jgi:DNA primase large subunit
MYDFTVMDYDKYPFIKSIVPKLQSNPLINQPFVRLMETNFGKSAMELAKIRILLGLKKKDNYDETPKEVNIKMALPLQSIMSYGIARMIVSCTNQYVIDKFIEAEASRSINHFLQEPEDKRHAIEGIIGFEKDASRIRVKDYIPLNLTKYDNKYKLINMPVVKGYVYINDLADRNLIFKEQIKKLLSDKLPLKVHEDARTILNPVINEFTAHYTAITEKDYGEVVQDDFPPCIKTLIYSIKKNENLTHYARFALVSFCNKIGMPQTEIIPLFQQVKDFELGMTAYQVDHITGKGGGVKYQPPSCESMKTNNLCRSGSDPLCSRVKHPVGYYESLKRRQKKQAKNV